jgi:hypothetical protein
MNNQQVKQIISFILKRSGKKSIAESEIYLILSMELQWCPPQMAKQFISEVQKTDLVQIENGLITPSFTIDKVSIPIDFKPTVEFFKNFKAEEKEMKHTNTDQFLEYLKTSSSLSKEEITNAITKIQDDKNITEHVAMLLFAKKHAIDISNILPEIDKEFSYKK